MLKTKQLGSARLRGSSGRRRRLKRFPDRWLCVLAGCLLAITQLSRLAEGRSPSGFRVSLSSSTLQAFQRYVATADTQSSRNLGDRDFLWIDDLPEKEKQDVYAGLKRGEIEMRRVPPEAAGANAAIPGGMIHDWKGIVFIPGVKLDQVLRVLQDYDHQATIYAPDVEKAKIEKRDGNHYVVFLRFRRTKVVTVVLDTEHDVNYFRDSPTRARSRSSAIRIAEVENPDGPNEEAGGRPRIPVEDGNVVEVAREGWRSVCAEPRSVVDQGSADRIGLADRTVHHQHSEGITGIHVGRDAEGRAESEQRLRATDAVAEKTVNFGMAIPREDRGSLRCIRTDCGAETDRPVTVEVPRQVCSLASCGLRSTSASTPSSRGKTRGDAVIDDGS
jgi:hypothetical protein